MDIAVLSMSLSQMKVAWQASVAVIKIAKDTRQVQMNDIVQMVQENTKMIEQVVNPHL